MFEHLGSAVNETALGGEIDAIYLLVSNTAYLQSIRPSVEL